VYSDLELDALRDLVAAGARDAAKALSQLLDRRVDVSVPAAAAVPLTASVDAVGGPETPVTAITLPLLGDVDGISILVFRRADADRVCELLGVDPAGELATSALAEIGNILCASYLAALGPSARLAIEPGPPRWTIGTLREVLTLVLARCPADVHVALHLDSNLEIEGEGASSCAFVLVPTEASVAELLGRLGRRREAA
jgi:chemotaxis protein CheC